MTKILIADNNKNSRESLKKLLISYNYNCFLAKDDKETLFLLLTEKIDLMILDIEIYKVNGIKILEKIKEENKGILPFLMICIGIPSNIQDVVSVMQLGAFDFLTKPINLETLKLSINKVLSLNKKVITYNKENEISNKKSYNIVSKFVEKKEQKALTISVNSFKVENILLGRSKEIISLRNKLKLISVANSNVYLLGESGTGKELVCNSIHYLSNRKGRLVKVNCAALSETLLESELFGHEKGSFTGASKLKKGRFEIANDGTLFLDEISEISSFIQIKLLRFLQERQFERVGGTEIIRVNVRIICASNKDLKEEVKQGRFREDLFYRLNVIDIKVPSLRERQGDITFLSMYYFSQIAKKNNKYFSKISVEIFAEFEKYSWPGNVRELMNIIEKMVVLATKNTLDIKDIPLEIRGNNEIKDYLKILIGQYSLLEIEEKIIEKTLNYFKGNKSKTAKSLEISRKKLYSKLRL